MKITITSSGPSLKSETDPRFGRCPYFIVYDTENDNFEALENSNMDGMGGVGIQSAQMIADKEVKAVITGHCGPNAFRTLNAAGIEIFTGAAGTIEEIVKKYKEGSLTPANHPNAAPHSGQK